MTEKETLKAFQRASEGKPAVMGITNHDFRDMENEVTFARKRIVEASRKYPEVKFKFCEAKEAFRCAVYGAADSPKPVKLDISVEDGRDRKVLHIETVQGKVFGPQPFLAVKTKSGRFIHDNLDFDTSLTKWSYTFDYDSIRKEDIDTIGIATNDKYGNTFVRVIENDGVTR